MARIPKNTIDRIHDTADIVEVVSQYVDLRRRGRNFFGLCPFHHEKTPSFSVAPDKNIYHCFGCGAGGSPINFVMEYEKITFVEAVQKLGQRYGIPVEFDRDESSREFFTQLYALHEQAADLYHKTLLSARGKPAHTYLLERGLSDKLLKEFRIGYAPESWDFLLKTAQRRQVPEEVLEKSGLFGSSEKGRFDRFRSRIMFPICDAAGKVIAFGGRVFESGDDAKYLNSPETPLYHKSEVLYGLHKTREAIRAAGTAILVEGYMDFLQLYQSGITNLLAVSGTALTDRHAGQIRKYTQRVFLAFDGDQAGRHAALRSGYTLYRGGVEPRVVPVPADRDPDDWVRSEGATVFQQAVEQSGSLVRFHLQVKNIAELSGVERSRGVRELLEEIGAIQDGILRGELLRELATEMSVEETDLLRVLKSRRRSAPEPPEADPQAWLEFTSLAQKAQVEIVRVLAGGDAEALAFAGDHLDLNLFSEPLLKDLAQALIKHGGRENLSGIVETFQTKPEREAAAGILFFENRPEDHNPCDVLRDCLISIRSNRLREQIKTARVRIRELEDHGQDPRSLIQVVARLQQELKQVREAYGDPG